MKSLEALLKGNIVEVSVPFEREKKMWECRVIPWEGFLRLATKSQRRGDQPFTVVRELRRKVAPLATGRAIPETLLLVVSAPRRLGEIFDFSVEERVVIDALRFPVENGNSRVQKLTNPTVDELADVVAEFRPDIIHLAGVDAHQAAALLKWPEDPLRHDGFVLRGKDGSPEAIGSEAMADALTARGVHAPRLVSFNCYNTGARMAALAVAKGARSAIGFQDTIDDRTAEQFFVNFYAAWRRIGWANLLEAFALSQQQVAAAAENRNVGDIVLWNDTSVFGAKREVDVLDLAQVASAAFQAAKPWLSAVMDKLGRTRGTTEERALGAPALSVGPGATDSGTASSPLPTPPGAPPPAGSPTPGTGGAPPPTGLTVAAREPQLRIKITPLPQLNYSLLHNRSPLFERFQIEAPDEDLPLDIEVKVQLFAGENSFIARRQHRLTGRLTNLHRDVHLPLVAPVLRGRREGITTAITSEVFHRDRLLHCETTPVRLLPPDEWTDTPLDRCWLPSFVLPRDPAVQRIVEGAQRFLQALADDSGAGFDGYQRVSDETDSAGLIEIQVRALWSALLYEHPVYYINPPPTYTTNAQRIRTPSQIAEEKRATCIDLALLFAASLEYIGVMPVMFLIHGHAFPGYWRSVQAYETFWRFGNVNTEAAGATTVSGTGSGDAVHKAWMVQGDGGLGEITRAIQSGGLIPLETTSITRRESFRSAQELGIKNLVTRWGFDAMADIQKAREQGVTPLPLLHLDL